MKSYIPRQPKQLRDRLEFKLERSLIQKLERYCQYMESDRDYVVTSILQIVFKKDKGFAEWLGSQDVAIPASTPNEQAARRRAV